MPTALVSTLSSYQASGKRAFFRPTGSTPLDDLVDWITEALCRTRNERRNDILIDVSRVTGFHSPDPEYRRRVARLWAHTVDNTVRVALLARPEHICPNRTGLVAAAAEGFLMHVCSTEDAAVGWLNAMNVSTEQLGMRVARLRGEWGSAGQRCA